MANKINWDLAGERHYEAGVDRGVYYQMDGAGAYPLGVAWNGLISVTESPEGAEPNPFYADNLKYLSLLSPEEMKGTIEAYTYPDKFGESDGSAEPTPGVALGQQNRKNFGMAYRTLLGNDVDGQDHGYKLHLVYGMQAAPSEKAFSTINDSPEPITFSWEFSTTPVVTNGYRPVSAITIDSTKCNAAKLAALEVILYGVSPATEGRLPLPDEVITLMTP